MRLLRDEQPVKRRKPKALWRRCGWRARGCPAGAKPVRHSDRGCQYCCHAYVEELEKHVMGASMTEEAHCYENALAERLNGILKQEYFLGFAFKTKAQAKTAAGEAVRLFNTKRPYTALKYKTPEAAHSAPKAA